MGKMDKRTKWSYCVGATGRDAAYALISMYLMTYVQYTMKLTVAQFFVISAGIVACLIWDAVNDLLMGIIIENCHFKWGKFKPWILTGACLNALVIIGLFTLRPQGWGFVAFFAIGYLLWGMTYTMNDIAYWGMLPSLSSDPKVRDTLVTLMSVFICIGQFSVAGIVPTVIAGNAVKAYRVIALIVGLGFIAFQTLVVLGVKEQERTDQAEKLSLKGMFQVFNRNDQLKVIGTASLLFNVGSNLLIIFGVNFFYFEFGYSDSGNLIFLFTVMYGLGTLTSQALYAFLSSKCSRMKILKICMAAVTAGYILLLGFGYVLPKNLILLNAVGFGIFFFQGLYNLVVIVMLNNTIEYDEYRFSERHDSVISAVRSFSVKLAGALNQGISALVLILSGIYVTSQGISELEIEVGKGTLTSESALSQANEAIAAVQPWQTFALRLGMVLIPVQTLLVAYLLIRKKYRISEEEYDRMVGEMKAGS